MARVTFLASVRRGHDYPKSQERICARPSASRSGARPRFATPIVLVVDDMEDNRDVVSIVLEQAGYHVEVAVDGIDAVTRARSLRPSLILMDLAMPKMDGFDATRAIRAVPALRAIPIIALSAFVDDDSTERALAAGCTAAVAKPCSPDELLAYVEAALGLTEQSAAG